MARRRGRFSERILEKAPRKGRKKVSKKKTPKVSLPEIINIPGIEEIELPKQKRKTKAKKADPKPDISRLKIEDKPKPKKRPPKVRITEAKPKVKAKSKAPAKTKASKRPKPVRLPSRLKIDEPLVSIGVKNIGKDEPSIAPKAKAKPKAKPKPKPKAKVKARPKPKPRPVKLPDILQEDIRITPGMLEGLTAKPVVKAKEKPKPKKEVKTPKKGKVREREDIRVPTREEIDKAIKDLNIKIPEVINIPGAGQVTIPSVPAVASAVPSAPKEKPTLSGVIGGIKKIEEAVKEV